MKLKLDSKAAPRIRGISYMHRIQFSDLQKAFTFITLPGPGFKPVKTVFPDNGAIAAIIEWAMSGSTITGRFFPLDPGR